MIGGVADSEAPGPRTVVRWQALAKSLDGFYPPNLLADVAAEDSPNRRIAAFRFLIWLSKSKPKTSAHLLMTAFRTASAGAFTREGGSDSNNSSAGNVVHERAFFDIVTQWCREWVEHPEGLRPVSVTNYCRDAAALLESLSGKHPAIPRNFRASSIRLAQPVSDGRPSLGAASWPELESLFGVEREREALRIARAECCRAFLESEAAYHLGQAILRGEIPEGADANACAQVRSLLLLLERLLKTTGSLTPNYLLQCPEVLGHPGHNTDLWRAAGFTLGPKTTVFRGPCLIPFVPTLRMVAAAAGVLICDTGWNVQPTLDMSSEPFVFRSSQQAFIGSPVFIESFKKRAGHHVLAYLGKHEILTDRRFQSAQEIWLETIEKDGNSANPEYAVIETESRSGFLSALDIMARFRAVANSALALIDGLAAAKQLRKHFWICSGETGLTVPDRIEFGSVRPKRDGINYKAIRKSVQIIRLDDSGSVRAVSRSAGHLTTSVIMPHYLNAPHIADQLDRNIRDFQNAIQGLLTRELELQVAARTLGMTEASLERMRNHAERAGIAAALGLVKTADRTSSDNTVIRFAALDDQNLSDLYLAHRALQELRLRTRNHARYRIHYLPMLAMAKAIGRELFRSGYGPRYVKAARSTVVALRAGSISLPFLGE